MEAQRHGGGADGSTWKADPVSPERAMGSVPGEGIHLPTDRGVGSPLCTGVFLCCAIIVYALPTSPPHSASMSMALKAI